MQKLIPIKALATIAGALLAGLATGHAQEAWPTKQVTVVVPFAAGGTTDMFGRIFAQAMNAKYGQPFVVENRAGAGGNIGSAAVARGPKDGYTLLVGTVSTHAINPYLYKNLPYDTEKDFQPVSLFARLPNLLVVHPRIPAKTLPEVIAHLKANDGKLSYGSSGVGTSIHLAAELFQIKTGTKMTHVPFRSSGEVMNNLIGGHIDLAFDNMTSAWPQAKAGKLQAIAVTSLERSAIAPEVPTMNDTLKGFDATSWHGLFAPAGTPQAIVDQISADVKTIFSSPEVVKTLSEIGAVPAPMTPKDFSAFIATERVKWQDVVKASGASAQ
jgi:tripartite-type tricarboxylate transporter receptor subunit TctC